MSLDVAENTEELKAQVEELNHVRRLLKELKDKESGLTNAVKGYFSGPTNTLVGTCMVKIVANKGRTTYNTKQMLEDGMDLEPYKKVGNPTLVLTVSALDIV